MRTHRLKTINPHYLDIALGVKTFEVRFNDRDFKTGDILILEEYDPEADACTGNSITARVLHILNGGQFGIEPGYVVMSLKAEASPTTPTSKLSLYTLVESHGGDMAKAELAGLKQLAQNGADVSTFFGEKLEEISDGLEKIYARAGDSVTKQTSPCSNHAFEN